MSLRNLATVVLIVVALASPTATALLVGISVLASYAITCAAGILIALLGQQLRKRLYSFGC